MVVILWGEIMIVILYYTICNIYEIYQLKYRTVKWVYVCICHWLRDAIYPFIDVNQIFTNTIISLSKLRLCVKLSGAPDLSTGGRVLLSANTMANCLILNDNRNGVSWMECVGMTGWLGQNKNSCIVCLGGNDKC